MDLTEELRSQILSAKQNSERLCVTGHGSKLEQLGLQDGVLLSVAEHSGVVEHAVDELVVTARSGTSLAEINNALARHHQCLASEPPQIRGQGTIGGAVSAGFSGPARPWAGSLRDAVLGVTLLTAQGEVLRYGGQVMKNVAGYDVSRLVAGACGMLGVVLDISLRVAPQAEHEMTLSFELDAQQAHEQCRAVARQPLPLTGTFWWSGQLWMRFSGAESALLAAHKQLGGDAVERPALWRSIADQQHEFFTPLSMRDPAKRLFRVSAPPASPIGGWPDMAVEWGGGVRWVWHHDPAKVHEYAKQASGWVWQPGSRLPVPDAQIQLTHRIKTAFDPEDRFVIAMGEPHAN